MKFCWVLLETNMYRNPLYLLSFVHWNIELFASENSSAFVITLSALSLVNTPLIDHTYYTCLKLADQN
jgi:hypothetical protein